MFRSKFACKNVCLRKKQYVLLLALLINLLLFIYFAFLQNSLPLESKNNLRTSAELQDITIIIREFEDFENSLMGDLLHYKSILDENINILIIADKLPYPPLNLNLTNNVKMINLDFSLRRSPSLLDVSNIIHTKFSLLVQDGCRIKNLSNLRLALKQFDSQTLVKAYALQTGKNELTCPGIEIDMRKWTVKIEDFSGKEGLCDFVDGDQAILIKTDDFQSLASPFTRPVPKSLYFQFASKRWKTLVFDKVIFSQRIEIENPMNTYQHKQLEIKRLEKTYKLFGIHQIIYNRNKHQYLGCTKDTERCFGSVINDTPDYIYQNRWTPPCCLKAIRETAIHVIEILEKNSIRYWLEGGSLLGAARHHDIIPWDYDVDIGIYQSDIHKCQEILRAKEKQYLDEDGFMWERGIEGDFFRVHYSDINRNHVDIFPFFSKNNIMTKYTWFKTHPQDREFPEHYLKPLTKIYFLGRNVSAPNNVKDFLEFKFGKGVIENPMYPNAKPVYQ